MTHAPLLSVREIEMQLRSRCEQVVRECLPNAVKDGPYLRVGSIAGEKGQSLAVILNGASRGLWNDYSATPKTPEGSGDMLGMVAVTRFGGDLGQAVAWAKSFLGLDGLDPARLATVRREAAKADADAEAAAAREAEGKKRGARALWLAGQPLTGACPASRYLAGRGIDAGALGAWPGSLRFHDEVWNRDTGVKLPAMLATMVTPDGAQVATHRTWLARDRRGAWVKADGAETGVPRGQAKKVLGKSGGAFVPIRKGATGKSMAALAMPETVYVTEGIEDALTVAMAKPDARVIAAYSLRNIGFIAFPTTIGTVVIVADRDEAPPGADAVERRKAADKLAALEAAIARQQARGHRVQIVMPPVGVKDVNAWLLATQVAA